MVFESFGAFFRAATGHDPYPYQARLAGADGIPDILDVPTGLGKTEAAVLAAYLWRRIGPAAGTGGGAPRRLVYCLPMRVLVEQTASRVRGWISRAGLQDRFDVVTLMGGDADTEWRKWPEREAVIVGTQDMLLSRALNRGYAMGVFQWPVEFGLLNNDCLWVIDEIQLMGNGLATTAQLEAFRSEMGSYGPHRTLWMSATVDPEWLRTADFDPGACSRIGVTGEDRSAGQVARRLDAPKTLRRTELSPQKGTYGKKAAEEVLGLHVRGTVTLVMVNAVDRAQDLFREISALEDSAVLVHSRFRPAERSALNDAMAGISGPGAAGRDMIVVSTQALEAGVDVSARTLVTEIAPWPSIVQRIGRCNRYGEHEGGSDVYVTEAPGSECAPYEEGDVERARGIAASMYGGSASPASLASAAAGAPMRYDAIVRRPDLIDLFDTSPDMSGSHTDVSRFVRSSELDTDVGLAWREWPKGQPPPDERIAGREVCSVPIGAAGRIARGSEAWRFDPLDGSWARAQSAHPGQVLLLRSESGYYDARIGFSEAAAGMRVPPPPPPPQAPEGGGGRGDAHGGDAQSEGGAWITLNDHTVHVAREMDRILDAVGGRIADAADILAVGARYHDMGKAHAVFQETMLRGGDSPSAREIWAKRPRRPGVDGRHSRPNFRHEAVSAVAFLRLDLGLSPADAGLAAYLIASHHGKVRLSMRTLPRRQRGRYVNAGGDYVAGLPAGRPEEIEVFTSRSSESAESKERRVIDGGVPDRVKVDASMARVGAAGSGRSWLGLSLAQLSRLGPFRLAYLEALLRAADSRASAIEDREGGEQ